LALAAVLLGLAGAQAQIVVPAFRVRGEVPQGMVERFDRVFRQQLGARTGLAVLPGKTVAPPLASRLEPEVAAAIALLGDGRYSVSGEIVAVRGSLRDTPYSVNLFVADAYTRRASDLLSYPLDEDDLLEAVAALTREVGAFIDPSNALARGTAGIFISSQPPSAEVHLNGVHVGETGRLKLIPLAPGRYEIEVRKKGFVPQTDVVTLEVGQIEFPNFSLVEIRGGSILVDSTPSADVFLDGRLVGRTPLTLPSAPGVRTLRVARPGFRAVTQPVTVRNFFVTRVPDVRLEPRYERLVYWTPPTGFRVEVDDIPRPRNFAANLRPGVHRVELIRGDNTITFGLEVPAAGVFELDFTTRSLVPLERE